MELKKLQYLESVYRLQNMSSAAAEQFVSQPAMSKSLHSLEDELGVKLIRRTPRGIAFTAAGELLAMHARRILKCVEDAENELRDLNNKAAHTVNFAVSQAAHEWILPLALSDFTNKYDGCRVIVHGEDTQQQMYDKLLSEDLDLAFTILSESHLPEEIHAEPLMHAEMKLVLPRNHRLADKPYILFRDLDGETIFTYPKGSILRRILEDKCREHASMANLTCVTHKQQLWFELVKCGAGLSFIVEDPFTTGTGCDELIAKSFEEPIYFDEGILTKTGHFQNKASRNLIKYLNTIAIHPESYLLQHH